MSKLCCVPQELLASTLNERSYVDGAMKGTP